MELMCSGKRDAMEGDFVMAVSNIDIHVDNEVKEQAQLIFASLGLDITTAVNIFLRQSIFHRGLPFTVTAPLESPTQQRTPKLGGWDGKIWMSDDFDAPLEDFKDYM